MKFELRFETGEGFSQRLLGDRAFQAEEIARTKIMTHVHLWCGRPGTAEWGEGRGRDEVREVTGQRTHHGGPFRSL